MKTFYVTTPIYYANSLPHLGHLYTTVVADCLRRHRRQRGEETLFLTGTDEHGLNIIRSAAKNGRTPREHVDYIVSEMKKFFAEYELDPEEGGYDIFMRTSEAFHYEGAGEFWRRVAANNTPKGRESIYQGFYEGWFCAPCGEYKNQDELSKPANETDAPLCLIHESPVDRVSEESYFFRLSDYDEALLKLYEERSDFVVPESRRNEVASFVRAGLQDISISRQRASVGWGIPVPEDPDHTVYIWFDALINYITALGYGSSMRREQVGEKLFDKFWPGLHLIGKDILRQHAILWPAMLLAAGVELPRGVACHGMWLDPRGRKMGKTLGNTIDISLMRRHSSADTIRYVLLREKSFGQDGRIGYETVIDRANSDLANGLGNFVSRTLTMIGKYFDGLVPPPDVPDERRLAAKRVGVDSDAQELASYIELARDQFLRSMEELAFNRALESAWGVIARVDKFLSDAKPWVLAKSDDQRETLGAVLYRAAETIRWLAVLLAPFMPAASKAIGHQLGLEVELESIDPAGLKWGELKPGTKIGEVVPIFPRIDKAKVMSEIKNISTDEQEEKTIEVEQPAAHATQAAVPGSETTEETRPPEPPMKGATEADAVAPAKMESGATGGVISLIGIEDFAKVEMRVATILTAERVPKADKLLRLTVDLNEAAPRQILAGIAQYYEPENLLGRKIIVVSNLQPRKMRGLESQGMLLAASVGDEGRPVLATFTEDVPNGARLK